MKPDCIVASRNTLGEVPLWSAKEDVLYWIDVRRPALYAYRPADASVRSWEFQEPVGSYCLRAKGGMLLAMKSGLFAFDQATGNLERLFDPEPEHPNNRLNDGKCDRQGRFWVGSMNDGDRLPTGSLFMIDLDLSCHRALQGITIPNSLAWSPDGRTMYFSDTPTLRIMAYDYDPASGTLSGERQFADLSSHPGRPDGSTVDIDGCLWNAEVRGSRVVRYTPNGKVDRIIELPVSGATSCAFGGVDMRTLYITTATQRLSEQELAQEPLAGGLFAVDAGVAGLAETPFMG